MQSREDRIRKQFKALKGRDHHFHDGDTAQIFMRLARQWKLPIVEIKRIVNYKGAATQPVVLKTPEHNRINRYVFQTRVHRSRGETTACIHDRKESRLHGL
jgi:hypothetical protein